MYISYRRDAARTLVLRPLKGCWCGPVAIRRPVGFDVFNVRLLIGLDKLLRKKRRYQGDLSASINDALLAVNLNTVKLVTLQGKKKQTARETQVVILRRLIRRIQRVAEVRGCSMNQLVNSGLLAYYSKGRKGQLEGSARSARETSGAIYDKMSSEERQDLMEILGSLTGQQEGAHEEFADGTYYEYDPGLKRTVEVDPFWERFSVGFSAGKLERKSQAIARKTAR